MTSADDFYWFPNVVGPIYPGTAIMFRVRPNGLDPRQRDHGSLDPAMAGRGLAAVRAQDLSGLDGEGLGPHHQSGLRQHGPHPAGYEIPRRARTYG